LDGDDGFGHKVKFDEQKPQMFLNEYENLHDYTDLD
jgi:hypothetical protein